MVKVKNLQQAARNRLAARDKNDESDGTSSRDPAKNSREYARFPTKARFDKNAPNSADMKWKPKYDARRERDRRRAETMRSALNAVEGASGQTEREKAKKLARGAVRGH